MTRKILFAGAALAFAVAALAACGASSDSASQSAEATTSAATSAPATTAPAGPTPEEIATAMAALPAPYNAADYDAGKRVFGQCRSCHVIEAGGGNRVGPNLHGVFDRHVGTAEGFAYSDALKGADFLWDADHLDHWLANPREFLPGNRMAFIGVRDETQRKNLIAYLMVESAK